MVKAVVLGTNGWYDTKIANTISLLIQTKEYTIILDAGLGINNLTNYYDPNLPAYLFISHIHMDHIYGIHTLERLGFKKGLTIFGQPSLKEELSKIFCYPYTIAPEKLSFDVSYCDAVNEPEKLPFKYEVAKLRHAAPTIGIRLEIENKIISYIADTGYCENAVKLAKGADLLFTESAHPVATPEVGEWPHLGPEADARIANEAEAKELVLVHFNPVHYPTLESRTLAEKTAKAIFPNSRAGFDGLEIEL